MATTIPPNRPAGSPPAGRGQPIQVSVVVQGQQAAPQAAGIVAPPLAGTPGPVPEGLTGRAADLAQASRFAGMAGQGRTAAALGSASQVAGGGAGAAGGAVGIAMQAVKAVIDGLEAVSVGSIKLAGDFSRAAVSLDPDRMKDLAGRWAEANAEAVGKVSPIAGVFAKAGAAMVTEVNSVSRELTQSANRLAEFGGQLASTTAEIEARKILRDVRRADELGGPLAGVVEAEDRLNVALERAQDRATKVIAPILTSLLDRATAAIEVLEGILKAGIETVETVATFAGVREAVRPTLELLRRLVENTDPAADPTDYTEQLREAAGQLTGLRDSLRRGAAAEQQAVRRALRSPLVPANF